MAEATTKRCPYCAEEIRAEAILCKHCRMPLTTEAAKALEAASEGKAPEAQDPALERLRRFIPSSVLTSLLEGAEGIEEGERRTVTVLFGDLRGFTEMSAAMDAEDLADLVDRAYHVMAEAVQRYEGVVDKFVGDAVLAIFGAPVMHEDDPERAVRAAMDLREGIAALGRETGLNLGVRVGINAGEVIVKVFGSEKRADYTAIGDAVNLASRLQGLAGEDEILVTERVAKRIEGVFDLEAMPPARVKGLKRPVKPHRVGRELKAFSKAALGERRDLTPFVGREFEMSALESLLGRTLGGRGQVAAVIAESGVGKSRLLYEFYRHHAEGKIAWYTGRCTSYGETVPYQPVSELLRRLVGIEESDDTAARRRRVREFIKRISGRHHAKVKGEPTTPEMAAGFEIPLGLAEPDNPLLALSPADRRRRVAVIIEFALLALARREPIAIVFEDMHWADELSLELLDRLTLAVARAPIMLIVAKRPLPSHQFPDKVPATQLALEELSQRESERLLKGLMQIPALPRAAQRFLWTRSQGNPFFMEEMIIALREQGVLVESDKGMRLAKRLEDASIPDTLEALILSRLDHLEAQVRRVVQCASVIGQEFRHRVLEHIAQVRENLEGAIGELISGDFILEKSIIPELEYLFRNALTRDVTYHTLLRKRRQAFHLQVAKAMERVYAERSDEHVELMAHHFHLGGAGEEARVHLRGAADKCKHLDANLTAIDFTERLLDVLRTRLGGGPELAGEIGDALLDLGRLHYATGDFASSAQFYDQAVEHAEEASLRQQRLIALRNRGDSLWLMGKTEEAEASLRQALKVCGPKDAEMRARCHLNLGVMLMGTGRLREAKRSLDRALKWYREGAVTPRDRYIASANLGLVCQRLGEMDQATGALDEALATAEEIGRKRERGEALLNRALLAIDVGDLANAKRWLTQSLRIGKSIDHARLVAVAELATGEVARHLGQLARAGHIQVHLLHEVETQGQAYLALPVQINLAQIRLAQGHLKEAQQHIGEAERVAAEQKTKAFQPTLLATRARIRAEAGETAKARRDAKRAVESVREMNEQRELPEILRSAGEVALATGKTDEARSHFDEALREAERLGLRREQAWALAGLSRAANGKTGAPQRKRARELAREIGDSLLLKTLR